MDLTRFLQAWRTVTLRDRQVVDALVDPRHSGPSPELGAALQLWPGSYYWSDEPSGRHLILTRTLPLRRRENWTLHALLFVATLVTTTLAGAVVAGVISFESAFGILTGAYRLTPEFGRVWVAGLGFSLPLLAILLSHEMGHYVTARRYGLDVSPPYFIPVPLVPSFIGTMGAFIRLRTIVSDRRQLLDVGFGGPIAGFVLALPALWIGLALSRPLPADAELAGLVLELGGKSIPLGDSLITVALAAVTGHGAPGVALHPLAFAGWVGMFVTMLNLLPIAQLDGGHILYAAVPRWHARTALAFWIAIVLLGLAGWRGWFYFGLLLLLLSRGRLEHPPVLDAFRPLPRTRAWSAWGALALFALTFTPVPFRI